MASNRQGLATHKRGMKLMGNRFEISVVAEDLVWADARIEEAVAEISRIERLLTTFRDDSQTNQINAQAGIEPVQVDQEVFDLVQRSLKISSLTQGAFDITYGSIDKRFWNFDTNMTALPDPALAKRAVRLINWENIDLDAGNRSIFLKKQGMRIGFGGIGKGYAADRAKMVLLNAGVTAGVVNASGDLITWGKNPEGSPWTVGIADPQAKHQPFSYLDISDMAVATSGNYEKYAVIGGKKYSHTIDPKTGMPCTGITSATIIAPNAELADAMATPIMVMGVEVGLHLINQIRGIACVIIDDNNRVFTSNNIRLVAGE